MNSRNDSEWFTEDIDKIIINQLHNVLAVKKIIF